MKTVTCKDGIACKHEHIIEVDLNIDNDQT